MWSSPFELLTTCSVSRECWVAQRVCSIRQCPVDFKSSLGIRVATIHRVQSVFLTFEPGMDTFPYKVMKYCVVFVDWLAEPTADSNAAKRACRKAMLSLILSIQLNARSLPWGGFPH